MDSKNRPDDPFGCIGNSQRLFNSLNVGYLLTNLDNVILDMNDAMERISGYTREEMIGRHVTDFLLESQIEELRRLDKRVDEIEDANDFFQYEFNSRKANGETYTSLLSFSANFDQDGNRVSFNNLFLDISEIKQAQSDLENEKKLLEAVLFGIGDCVTVFSVEGRMLIESPNSRAIRGNRQSPLLPLVHGNEKSINLKVGKETRSYSARIKAVHDDKAEVFAFVETLTDTTDRKKLEKQTRELNRIRKSLSRREIESKMVGKSRAMEKIVDLIIRWADVDSNVLILGETGVGKEVAAKAVHNMSQRKDQPFIGVNCGALPDALLESELFGHVKGAFTGATADRPGLFREASGGTLFLDEIGDISPQMQVKLLRALQEKEIRPLGGSRTYNVDVRVITATNKDLDQLMHQGRFRADLYYRIAVIPMILPPLRERGDDILLLARHFIEKYDKNKRQKSKTISHKGQALLMHYSWPGNIRELENAIEYALAMSRSETVRSTDFPFKLLSEKKASTPVDNLKNQPAPDRVSEKKESKPDSEHKTSILRLSGPTEEEEKEAILSALNVYIGKRELAAEALGISRASLWRKMKKHGLSEWKYQKETVVK